jgi:hydrogenase maturation protease
MQKILIYGVGNPFRCDDAVGIKITEELKKRIKKPNITIKSGSIDGLSMLDEILGYNKVLFVDSIKTTEGKPGDIYKIKVNPLKKTPSLSASHTIDFITAVRLGREFGYKMPTCIDIYAVEIEDSSCFSEECTEKVKASIPEVVERIMKEIKQKGQKKADNKETEMGRQREWGAKRERKF